MRAISLTQPWASLMAWDAKRYETRDWSTSMRGEIAIVASKGFPRECREICHTQPFAAVLNAHGVQIVSTKPSGPTQLPLGHVLAVVELDECIATAPEGSEKRLSRSPIETPAAHELAFGNYGPGRFALITRGVRALPHPVPVERIERGVVKPGGALGFYELSPACERAVREQLQEIERSRSVDVQTGASDKGAP